MVLQELAVTRSGVTELRDSLKRFDSGLQALATREDLGRLISKPGQLKELCDTLETSGLTTSQYPSYHSRISLGRRTCLCRKRVIRSRQAMLWGPWQASADTSTAHDHLPDCICYSQDAVVSSKRLAVGFKGLQGLVNRAIEVSFSYSFGAGGCSLSPGFTYYPTVDRRRDLAFRVMGLFAMASSQLYESDRELGTFLVACLENMALLYRRGRASPKAVDLHGRGVLHYLNSRSVVSLPYAMMTRHGPFVNTCQRSIYRCNLLGVLDMLVRHGVQTAMYDTYGACVNTPHLTRSWNSAS